ncbi:(p)ppGpp synthase/HD superfamily hydrolase [Pullulanibacillus pueri]|uniref:Phosphohydrolase n=1 Tax=Pullulanibacillus pueri TaxID=1437324 RepID=A0A8J2ZUX8_9BACL|nr:HD domain-containing protein [Pullulanibacillus pueri]MBM7682148.1 (p)ppGpp synthase/HD superfamily hydrolase [Pullulanibacillus pueri]GGH80218.1 phosphohydrolase [Pullulanibacillus pueri]
MAGLTNIDIAIAFAAKAHEGQQRKASEVPYISHPFGVAMLLVQAGCSEAVVIAGLLHDTLEDTETTYDQLLETFGQTVADYVKTCSEPDKSKVWEERKQHTIDTLQHASEEVCSIICADKIHNLRSMNTEFEQYGEALWEKFKRGKQEQKWYYEEISKILAAKMGHHPLCKALQDEMYKLF